MIRTLESKNCNGFSRNPFFFRREVQMKTYVKDTGLQGIIDELKPAGACVDTIIMEDKPKLKVMQGIAVERKRLFNLSAGD